jgi:hypothetical protein
MQVKTSKSKSPWSSFEIENKDCAGIDLSSTFHVSFVPPHLLADGEANRPSGGACKEFAAHTTGLLSLSEYLTDHGVKQVVIEATGSQWFGTYEILEKAGFSVCVINPAHAKSIAGRKTDELDAEWLCRLHTFGLLRASFIPERDFWPLRSFTRQRQQLITDRTTYVQRIQKELDVMNVKLHKVISNIMKGNGRAILDFVALGPPAEDTDWSEFYNDKYKCEVEDFVVALKGSFTFDRCLLLRQHLAMYDQICELLGEVDLQLEVQLFAYEQGIEPKNVNAQRKDSKEFIRPLINKKTGEKRTKGVSNNSPLFDVKSYLIDLLGVDAAEIPGLSDQAVLELVAETGTNLQDRFPTAKHFSSWLKLAPNQKISAGKLLGHGRVSNAGKAHQIFRNCSYGLINNKGPLGQKLRSMKIHKFSSTAYKALAHQLAILYYIITTTKQPFDESKLVRNDKQRKKRQLRRLKNKAEEMGYALVAT